EGQLADRGVAIELTDEARDWLAKKGYDPAMGARPLGRVIQEKVKRPLAEELLFGKLTEGGTVLVELKGDELAFSCEESKSGQKSKANGEEEIA
ncbi:MAG TPA: ATP-dependent Clp protease ATP-binding subunit ClpA, partial [Micavibrio sp.]